MLHTHTFLGARYRYHLELPLDDKLDLSYSGIVIHGHRQS